MFNSNIDIEKEKEKRKLKHGHFFLSVQYLCNPLAFT